jgi:hypothetical protein
MRRFFTLFLVTPLLASCSDSVTPMAPSSAVHSAGDVRLAGDVATEENWLTEENWFTPGGAFELVEEEGSMQAVGAPGAPASRVMVFGNPDAGTDYPVAVHDKSYHGKDRINPGAVVVPVGGTVTFQIYPGHRVAIYAEGVKPEDIKPSPGYYLSYPVNRLYLQPAPTSKLTLKVLQPGRYLVICAVNTHFFQANMWGWLIVE